MVAWEALFLCIWERTRPIRRERKSAIVGKNRRLVKTLKEALIGHIVLKGTLTVIGGRGQKNGNCRRIAINVQIQKVCMEGRVGFEDM